MSAEVPEHISDAAEQVESYFHARGILTWALGGVQSRYRGTHAAELRVVECTHTDLYRALMMADEPPQGIARVVGAVMQQLGLCCLGGKILRLRLPNGRTLRVTLE